LETSEKRAREMLLPLDSGKVFMPLAAMAAVVATASRTAEATLFLSSCAAAANG